MPQMAKCASALRKRNFQITLERWELITVGRGFFLASVFPTTEN